MDMAFFTFSIVDQLVFAVIGRIAIFYIQKFPLDELINIEFIEKLRSCDLCLGFWVYLALSFLMQYSVMYGLFGNVVTAMVFSLAVWLIKLGFNEAFSNVIIG